jgi:hypothetical protein
MTTKYSMTKKRTFYNTDGIIKCLLQPGHIRNQLFTSMLATSFHLLNLVYPDSSCCRDKISRAAGRRAVGSVFCSPFIKCTVTSKWRFHYRDSYVIGFYRDKTTSRHLPGLAKNSPTPTQAAPNYTTEPLGFIAAKRRPVLPRQLFLDKDILSHL